MVCAGCEGGNARTPQFLYLPHAHACLSWVRGWVGGCQTPPLDPRGGGGGHLSVCGYAKILGGWVPELTPPPRVAKQTLICGPDWRSSPRWNSTRRCSRRWTSRAPGKLLGGGRYQTTVSSVPQWLPDDIWQAVQALLGFSLPPLEGLEALCPKIIERWEAEPWKGFQIPHRDFALPVNQSLRCMVVSIPLTTSPPSKSLQVCPGTQGGYHAANRWDIVIQPLRSVTLLRGTVIHRGAGGPGRALFIPFAALGYRSRMLTVEKESVTELMNSVPVMASELVAEGAAVGSPLGTEASLNFSPLDEGSEEAEAVPVTNPVPAPQEEDMPEAPADAEDKPAAPADADAAPPPTECGRGGRPRA